MHLLFMLVFTFMHSKNPLYLRDSFVSVLHLLFLYNQSPQGLKLKRIAEVGGFSDTVRNFNLQFFPPTPPCIHLLSLCPPSFLCSKQFLQLVCCVFFPSFVWGSFICTSFPFRRGDAHQNQHPKKVFSFSPCSFAFGSGADAADAEDLLVRRLLRLDAGGQLHLRHHHGHHRVPGLLLLRPVHLQLHQGRLRDGDLALSLPPAPCRRSLTRFHVRSPATRRCPVGAIAAPAITLDRGFVISEVHSFLCP